MSSCADERTGGVGSVALVGAGPGAPGLITVAGVRRLERADVVVYDYLASPRLLDYAPPQAERILVGKHGGGQRVEQRIITELLLDRARRGLRVVRLKGGDPFVFGRGGEEAEALAAAGIPYEIVPGVTSAVAAPAYAGIPLTHRDLASSFTVLTGYEYPDKQELAVHWDAVAQRGNTLVFLMTTRQLANNMDKLLAHGVAPDTPAAVVRWGTVADQQTLVATVSTIAAAAAKQRLQPPAVVVIGDVVRLREPLHWFERKPLFGRRIVVTRPRAQAAGFIDALAAAGADVIPCPTIEIVAPPSWAPLDAAIGRVESYDWIVLTSVNGVAMFFDRLRELRRDVRVLHRAKIAAVGPETAAALAARGVLVDIMPQEFRAEAVASAMCVTGLRGQRVLLPRAAGAREILPALLREGGAEVDEVASYQTAMPRTDMTEVRALLAAGAIDLVTFTSSSTVRHFLALLGGVEPLRKVAIGCIGPITAATAHEFGLQVAIQPAAYTIAAFTAAILEYFALPDAKETIAMEFPTYRPRRLRRNETFRRMVRETRLSVDQLILPLFVVPGSGVNNPVSSMPGVSQMSIDKTVEECRAVRDLGLPAVILFGVPEKKDPTGSHAYRDDGVVPSAVAAIKKALPDLMVITDVCLCEYTDHGHCGVLVGEEVDNDATIDLLAKEALTHARAGADMVAPSDMMDGRVNAIRDALDEEGFEQVPIMSYAAKFASGFYGPFREAAESTPQFGDRRGYQMDPPNAHEALREVEMDIGEGADIVMVKPALAYLDLIWRVKESFGYPVAAYQVSGEYAMIKAAAQQGWLDEQRIMMETLIAIRRAGADMILTYFAKQAARLL